MSEVFLLKTLPEPPPTSGACERSIQTSWLGPFIISTCPSSSPPTFLFSLTLPGPFSIFRYQNFESFTYSSFGLSPCHCPKACLSPFSTALKSTPAQNLIHLGLCFSSPFAVTELIINICVSPPTPIILAGVNGHLPCSPLHSFIMFTTL